MLEDIDLNSFHSGGHDEHGVITHTHTNKHQGYHSYLSVTDHLQYMSLEFNGEFLLHCKMLVVIKSSQFTANSGLLVIVLS